MKKRNLTMMAMAVFMAVAMNLQAQISPNGNRNRAG